MATTTPEIDLANFARRQQEGARVLDVREPGEYVEGHVPGAMPVPMAQLPDGWVSWTPPSRAMCCALRETGARR